VKHDVAAAFHTPQAGANIGSGAPQSGVIGKHRAARFDFVEVARPVVRPIGEACKRRSPVSRPHRAARNGAWPRLAPSHWKIKGPTDSRKDVALSYAAGVAFINGAAQHGQLRLVLLFLAFQSTERSSYHLAGVFVASAIDLRPHKVVEL